MKTELKHYKVADIVEGFEYNELEGKGLFGLDGRLTIQPQALGRPFHPASMDVLRQRLARPRHEHPMEMSGREMADLGQTCQVDLLIQVGVEVIQGPVHPPCMQAQPAPGHVIGKGFGVVHHGLGIMGWASWVGHHGLGITGWASRGGIKEWRGWWRQGR